MWQSHTRVSLASSSCCGSCCMCCPHEPKIPSAPSCLPLDPCSPLPNPLSLSSASSVMHARYARQPYCVCCPRPGYPTFFPIHPSPHSPLPPFTPAPIHPCPCPLSALSLTIPTRRELCARMHDACSQLFQRLLSVALHERCLCMSRTFIRMGKVRDPYRLRYCVKVSGCLTFCTLHSEWLANVIVGA